MDSRFSRVIDPSHARIPEHAHDWPVVSIFVLGSYLNETDIGERLISGPSIVFYRAGAAHRNTVGADGFEQIEIEFDPAWLGRSFLPDVPAKHWIGGNTRTVAQSLLRAHGSEVHLRPALRQLFERWDLEPKREPVRWIDNIAHQLKTDTTLTVTDLARSVNRHPAWVGSAFRAATGEGLQETAARFRVERAARLLRETDEPCARIALDDGFCDQSHMNRTFRHVLGRSPTAVRDDRLRFRRAPQ